MTGWVLPTLDEALSRYADLTGQLADLHGELGEIQYAELGARRNAWLGSQEGTVTGRGRDADMAAVDWTMDLVRKRAEIAAAEAELRYLDHVLEKVRP